MSARVGWRSAPALHALSATHHMLLMLLSVGGQRNVIA